VAANNLHDPQCSWVWIFLVMFLFRHATVAWRDILPSTTVTLFCDPQYPRLLSVAPTWGGYAALYYISSWRFMFFDIFLCTTLFKKYPTLGQEEKSCVPGGAQFQIPFKLGPLWLHTLSPSFLPLLEAFL
jgi:hypothetical protein